jgi:hypothetical protein
MKLFIKSEKRNISELSNLLKEIKIIKDGYIIKEELEQIKLEKYSGGQIEIKDNFYSLTVFDKNTEVKITRDGKDLYFRQMSEKSFNDATKSIDVDYTEERTFYLKGKYDKDSKMWWESAFSTEFDYPLENIQSIPHESRAGLKVKVYWDEEGEIRYYRFYDYVPVVNIKKED